MKKNVLIVDDDAFRMASMVDHLSDEGYDVEIVTNLSSACAALLRARFDVMIVDCMMPTGDEEGDIIDPRQVGVELIRRIRGGAPQVGTSNMTTPIVVLTALCDRSTLEELKDVEPTMILQKPASLRDVLALIEEAVVQEEPK